VGPSIYSKTSTHWSAFPKGDAFLNQSDAAKVFWRRIQVPAICFCLITSFLICSCLYFLMDCFPNTPVECHFSLLRRRTVCHCGEINSLGNRRSGCLCVALPCRQCAALRNPVPYTSDSFPSAVKWVTNNNRAVAGGKNRPWMGKFTSDWVGCLQTWKLDWGEQSRNCKLIRFAEAVLYEFLQLPVRRDIFKMGLIANLIMAARKLNWNMK